MPGTGEVAVFPISFAQALLDRGIIDKGDFLVLRAPPAWKGMLARLAFIENPVAAEISRVRKEKNKEDARLRKEKIQFFKSQIAQGALR